MSEKKEHGSSPVGDPLPDDCSMVEVLGSDESRRQFLRAIGGAGIVGLAGCTGDGGGEATTTQDNSGTTEDGGTDTDDGDDTSRTLRLNAVQRFGTIDPAKGTDYTQTMAMVNLYDPLVFPTPEGEIRPHLAEDWTVSDDSTEFTFTIREGAQFHSGNPVRAEDVKFSLERLLDINQGFASQFADLVDASSVTVDGERQVTFELDQVFSPFISALVLLFVVDKETVMDNAADGEFGDRGDYGQEYLTENDAGSGPYTLGSFDRGTSITWERFDDYWMEFPDGAYDTVRAEIITEDSTVRSLMRSGDLDMTSQYQSNETFETLAEESGLRVEEIPTATMFYFKINTQKSPVDDPAVREAMAWGFDYETARTEIAPGSRRAIGPIPELFAVHNGDIEQPTYDPERARQILADAGYSEGEIQVTNTYVQDFGLEERMGLLFQENMDAIGIDVELRPQTWGTITDRATSVESTPHLTQVFYGPIKPHPDSFFFNQYHSEAANSWINMEHLEDDQVDSLIDEARATVDPDARGDIYRDLQERIAGLTPDLFVFNQVKRIGFQDNVKGYTFRPAQSYDYWWHDYYFEE